MTDSRDSVLAAVARGTHVGTLPPGARLEHPGAPPHLDRPSDREGMIASFTRELEKLMGTVHRVADDAQARARVMEVLEARGVRRVLAWDDQWLRPVGFGTALREAGVVVEPCWLPPDGPRADGSPQGARRRRRRDHRCTRRAGRYGQPRRRQRPGARAHRVAAAADAHRGDWRRAVVAHAYGVSRAPIRRSPTSAATSSRSPVPRARATSRARSSSAFTARATFTSSSSDEDPGQGPGPGAT